VARGWEKLPANEILNRANSFDKPIFLIRKCGHVAWVNNHLKNALDLPDNLIREGQIEQVYGEFGSELYERHLVKGKENF